MMPALKLTKSLYLEQRLNKELIDNVKDYEKKNHTITGLLQLLTADDAKQQIEKLKEVLKKTSKTLQDNEPGSADSYLLGHFLVHLFFISTTKNPSRRVIISAFQSFPEHVLASVIGPNIKAAVTELFQQPIKQQDKSDEPITVEECLNLRHNVETVSALIENFPLGESCVISCCLETLSYLGKLQNVFHNTFGTHLSPVQQNEVMHHSLDTVKLANRVCQRSAVTMETRLNDPVAMATFLQTAASFIRTDIAVLQTDEFLLDCKTTSGMNICLLLKFTSVKDNILGFLAKAVFHHSDWMVQHDKAVLPDWLISLDIDQISANRLSACSYLCMCYGILTMVSMETQLYPYDGKCFLLDVLLPEFLILTKRCTDVSSKLLAAKSVHVLTQRIRGYLQKDGLLCCDPDILRRFDGQSADMTTILDYVWMSWEDSVDAIRFTVKDLFENVVSIHTSVSPTENGKEDQFLCGLTKSILTDVSWSCKGKYGTLAVLVGHVGSARMLAMHDGIAGEILEQLKEHTLSCYASELYESLFRCHQSQLPPGGHSETAWYATWVDPVISVLCDTHKLQKKHAIEYILPKLLKMGQDTLHYMITTLTTVIDTKGGQDGYDKHKLTQTENQLGALVMCLRRARVMGQLRTMPEVTVQRSNKKKRSTITAPGPADPDTEDRCPGSSGEGAGNQKNRSTSNAPAPGRVEPGADVGCHGSLEEGAGSQTAKLWCGVVSVDLLRQALICKDEQIRLDAFALLCENQKTSETISDTELDLIQSCLPQNLNSHDPAFRQFYLSHLKKFLYRMKESSIALKRQVSRNKEAAEVLKKYKEFLTVMTRCLFSCLYPGCVFAKRTTCLGALSIILNTYKTETTQTEHDFSFYDVVRQCDVTCLLECLTDTYEDNKAEAASILIACSQAKAAAGVMDNKMTVEMTDLAFQLSQSTRPQDCLTAAYLFKVLLSQPSVFQVFRYRADKLCTEPTTVTDTAAIDTQHNGEDKDSRVITDVVNNKEVDVCINPDYADTADHHCAKTADLCEELSSHKSAVLAQCTSVTTELTSKSDVPKNLDEFKNDNDYLELLREAKDSDLGRKYTLLCLLLHSLQEQVTVAGRDLIVAAANQPLYPTMLCMRYCLMHINFRNIQDKDRPNWQRFFTRLISLCLEISAVVSPVVQNSSPEGNIPLDEIPGRGIIEDPSDESQTRSHSTVMLMPEYLIVCCWRSIKEISLIFGQLTTDLPIACIDQCSSQSQDTVGLLTLKQVLEIGQYFTVQLLESVHRGAFELAYAGFVKLTDMLWRSSVPDLHRLPKRWLDEVMQDIMSGSPESRLCATRRSAGVPFYVQALVSTEPVSTGRVCLRNTIQQLLGLAFDETMLTADSSSAKVHALNILRALFKDSRLKDDVAPYMADGLKVAVLGFKSDLWNVRNTATLLMTAMMTRIFGVKRSKDETSFSRKNCQTGKTFFFKFPSLYQFLLDQLSEATQDLGNQLHPGLFPILMVLGRLFPSTMEGTDTSLNLAAFIPLVIKCSSSPVLKTRVMAARALQPLVEKDHVTNVFADLLSMLPCQPGEPMRQNQIHGVLLQVKELIGTVPQLPQSVQVSLGHVVSDLWSSRLDLLISRANLCLSTRKEALEVTAQILAMFAPIVTIQTNYETVLYVEVLEEQSHLSLYQYSPGLSEFRCTVCDLYFNHVMKKACDKYQSGCGSGDYIQEVDEVSLVFLKSDAYEVRTAILVKLTESLKRSGLDMQHGLQPSLVICSEGSKTGSPLMKGDNSIVGNLKQSYAYLLRLADEESHEECQGHLFRLLAIHPKTIPTVSEDQSGKDMYQSMDRLCQLMEKLCQRIENQSLSDSVVAAIVDYAGSLLLSICMVCEKGQQTVGNQSAVTRFLGMVESFSRSDCSAEIHMACVLALQKTCRHILRENKDSAIGCHANRLAVFRSTLALLQADDPDVREAAADIQSIVSQSSLNVRAHPYVCMRLFLEEWAELQTSADVAVASLCQLMYEQDEKQQARYLEHCMWGSLLDLQTIHGSMKALEERLFDRGELNAYRDEIDLLQNIDEVILKTLSARTMSQKKDEGAKLQSAQLTDPLSLTKEVFVKLINDRLENTDITELNLLNTGLTSIFENTSEYQRSMLSLYRLLVLIKYGKNAGDPVCRQKCIDLVKTLKLGIQVDHLPTLLRELMEALSTTNR